MNGDLIGYVLIVNWDTELSLGMYNKRDYSNGSSTSIAISIFSCATASAN